MEQAGIRIDTDKLATLGEELATGTANHEARIQVTAQVPSSLFSSP